MYLGFYAEDFEHLAMADWTPSTLQASALIRVLYVYFTGLIQLKMPIICLHYLLAAFFL
jgi:hypothetical protein